MVEEDRETKIEVLMKVGLKREVLDKLNDDKINLIAFIVYLKNMV